MPEHPTTGASRSGAPPRRVLFVTYYFPPSGGSGVQRALKTIKYLPAFGWRPTVLTVRAEDASYPELDETLVADVPRSVEVIRTRSWDPYALYALAQGREKRETVSIGFVGDEGASRMQRLARWVRANLFIPDARVGWVPFATRAARRLVERQEIDAVVTTGPPHSTHLVGRALNRRYGLPWVADFRDPWTDITYYEALPHTAPALRLDAALEQSVLSEADAVVSVSDGWGRLLERRASMARYRTIPNGFDPEDVPALPPVPPRPDRFVVAHVGVLTAVQHAPGFVEALARRYREDPAWRARLRLRFVGMIDASILEALDEAGLGDALEVLPYVPHAEAIDHMREADVLMVAAQRVAKTEGVMPGKAFEYLRVGVPVLALAAPEGDLAGLLAATRGGRAFAHDDAEGIGRFLDRHFARTAEGRPPEPIDEEALGRYDRRRLTGRLAGLLDEITGRPAG